MTRNNEYALSLSYLLAAIITLVGIAWKGFDSVRLVALLFFFFLGTFYFVSGLRLRR